MIDEMRLADEIVNEFETLVEPLDPMLAQELRERIVRRIEQAEDDIYE